MVEVLDYRKVNVGYVQETRWTGLSCRFFGAVGRRYTGKGKLFSYGCQEKTEDVGVFVAEKWVDPVIQIDRYNERIRAQSFIVFPGYQHSL